MPNNKNSVEFNDLEGTNFSITYMPKFNQFSVSITDSCGRSTNSISIGYEDLRSIFKEAENMFFKNMDIVRDERSIPKGSSEAEFRGYLDEIRITKKKSSP